MKIKLTIDKAMQEKGLSIAELKDLSGVAYGTLLAYQRGVPRQISLDVLGKVLTALEVSPKDVFVVTK